IFVVLFSDVKTIMPVSNNTAIAPSSTQPTTTPATGDPCYNYTALDQPWRATNATRLRICDARFNGNGWYRLLYNGMNIRMPESCTNYDRCGTYITFWLNGSHPQISDGIVSRQACGRGYSGCCEYSVSIRVKACPGNYYVYEFVKPNICPAAYCSDVSSITPVTDSMNANSTEAPVNTANITSDPCSVYRNFSSNGRNPIPYSSSSVYDDTLVEWNGWYRLYLQGSSAQIPELHWCSSYMACGGYAALLLEGPHPLPEDGIVTRDIYGFYPDISGSKQCIKNSRSNPIQVKACPGNYYVYRLVKPPVSLPMPTYCAVVIDTPSYDPCSNYTSLDQSWRGTNETGGSNCDRSTNWNGWYRLLYNGMSTQMPESCVNVSRCGTDVPLWLSGSHPQISDGIVTRGICGNYGSDCCFFRSNPIQVKACPGNYYVYRLVKPPVSLPMPTYCADVKTIMPVSNNTAIAPSSTQPTTTPATDDPCYNYTALDQPWRATNASRLRICDDYFNWNGWYRLLYYGMNIRMPESCTNYSSCGTYITFWLNGSHPQISDGIISRQACGSRSGCCQWSVSIRVKACPGNYYVYEFVSPNVFRAAYCAGTQIHSKSFT
ncbi:hypothetical protein AMEX_G24606, partial [Astyanax mexicanus]